MSYLVIIGNKKDMVQNLGLAKKMDINLPSNIERMWKSEV